MRRNKSYAWHQTLSSITMVRSFWKVNCCCWFSTDNIAEVASLPSANIEDLSSVNFASELLSFITLSAEESLHFDLRLNTSAAYFLVGQGWGHKGQFNASACQKFSAVSDILALKNGVPGLQILAGLCHNGELNGEHLPMEHQLWMPAEVHKSADWETDFSKLMWI